MRNHYDRIIAYMEAHGSITPMDAFRELGETKLSTRIVEFWHGHIVTGLIGAAALTGVIYGASYIAHLLGVA